MKTSIDKKVVEEQEVKEVVSNLIESAELRRLQQVANMAAYTAGSMIKQAGVNQITINDYEIKQIESTDIDQLVGSLMKQYDNIEMAKKRKTRKQKNLRDKEDSIIEVSSGSLIYMAITGISLIGSILLAVLS